MKGECLGEKLRDTVLKCEKFSGRNTSLPILSCIYIEAGNNTLTLRATNLEVGIEITLPAKITTQGVVTVPAQTLSSFLSNTPYTKNISFEEKNKNLHLSSEKGSTLIKTQPHEDFPTLPKTSHTTHFTINSKHLLLGLRSVWYSSSASNIKPELSSVYIYPQEGNLIFVATDSFRLAEKKVKVKNLVEFEPILLPFKNTNEIIKILDLYDDDAKLTISKNQLTLELPQTFITTRVVDGVFPDYKQIIPKESETEATLLKQDLLNALKVANVFSDKFHQLKIHADTKNKHLTIETKNPDVGETVEHIPAAITGKSFDTNFNYRYIFDCIPSFSTDSIVLRFNPGGKPLLITGVNDRSFQYIVMPMNR